MDNPLEITDSSARVIDAAAGLFWALTPLSAVRDVCRYWNGAMTEGN